MLFICSLIAIYFNVITAWSLMYVINSLKFTLPWATCGNPWNTEACSVWNKGAVEICRQMNGTIFANGTCSLLNSAASLDGNLTATELALFPKNHVIPSLEFFQFVHETNFSLDF